MNAVVVIQPGVTLKGGLTAHIENKWQPKQEGERASPSAGIGPWVDINIRHSCKSSGRPKPTNGDHLSFRRWPCTRPIAEQVLAQFHDKFKSVS